MLHPWKCSKARLDGALNILIEWELSLPVAGEWDLNDSFRPKPFDDSVIL